MNVGWGTIQLTRYTTATGRILIDFCASKLLASSFTCWSEEAVSSNTEGSQTSEQFLPLFYSESILRMRWPKYWSFSFSIIPSKEISGLKILQNSCQEGPACGKRCVNLFFFSNHSQVGRVRLSLHGLNKGTLV